MKKQKNIKINFILHSISQLVTLLIPLITTPYISRVLHEDGIGKYSFSYSIIMYFSIFANLGFTMYGQREIAKNRDDIEKKSRVFWEIVISRFITTAFSLLILYLLVIFVGFGKDHNIIIYMLSIQVIATIFDINFYFQGVEKFLTTCIRNITAKLIGLIGIFVFVKDEKDVWLYALCLSFSVIFANIITWFGIFKEVKFVKLNSLSLKKHFVPSILIFLPTLAVTIYTVVDRTMIGYLSSNPDYDNGCYEQAYKINSIALLPVTVVSVILSPRNTYDYDNGNMDSFNRHVKYACELVMFLGFPMIVGFSILSGNLCSWFLGNGFDTVPLLLCIMSVRFIVSGFGTIFGEMIFISIGKEKYPTIATFIGAFVNVVLNAILIRYYGALGAAITTAISECVVTSVLLICVLKTRIVHFYSAINSWWKYIIAALVMFVPVYFINSNIDYSIISFILCVLAGVATYGIVLLFLQTQFLINNLKNILNLGFKIMGSLFKNDRCIDEVYDNENKF